MKFTWFNLMPWPDLPDDFRESQRSVWVDAPSELYDPERGNHVYHEYMDQLEHADSLGFDAIGVNEHHQNGYGLMPSPTLIVLGREGRFIPPVYAERFAALLPDAEVAWVDRAGHMVPYEQPQAVAEHIRRVCS